MINVQIRHDRKNGMYIATNNELGLLLKSDSKELLKKKVREVVPELLELNRIEAEGLAQ